MPPQSPSFPPDVARDLQRMEGSVSFRYTLASSAAQPTRDTVLMETPYEKVLAALILDTGLTLRFVRTGGAEGSRVARVNVAGLIGAARHWDVALSWDPESLSISVRDRDDPGASPLVGRWP